MPADARWRRASGCHGECLGSKGLRKEFGTSVALDGLDLDVHVGEVFGFVGPNGGLQRGTPPWSLIVLVAVTVVGLSAALWGIDRRDLRAG